MLTAPKALGAKGNGCVREVSLRRGCAGGGDAPSCAGMETSWTRLRFWALMLAGLAGAGWVVFREPERSRPPGVLCAQEPVQGPPVTKPETVWRFGGWTLTPLASYSVRARVLSAKRYKYDYTAPLAPVDLALGWGRMSDSAVLDEFSISQRGRWYNYSYDREVIPRAEITRSSANTHIIPANDAVRDVVLDAIRGDIVRLDGWLVECRPAGDGPPWRSSLSRTDTEGGACEIMLVEKAVVEK